MGLLLMDTCQQKKHQTRSVKRRWGRVTYNQTSSDSFSSYQLSTVEWPNLHKQKPHQEQLMPESSSLEAIHRKWALQLWTGTEETASTQEWSQKWLHCLQGRNTPNRQKYNWTVTALYKQPLYLTAWFSGFWEVTVEYENSIFPMASRISESVYMSALAENVSFFPSSALFPFNESFAVNPICELLK